MPHVLVELQGLQECVPGPMKDAHGHEIKDHNGSAKTDSCGNLEVRTKAGSMNSEEYRKTVDDLVNFLTYVGEPGAEKRKRTGVYVFLFLGVLLVFTWLLNREYWKDVH